MQLSYSEENTSVFPCPPITKIPSLSECFCCCNIFWLCLWNAKTSKSENAKANQVLGTLRSRCFIDLIFAPPNALSQADFCV